MLKEYDKRDFRFMDKPLIKLYIVLFISLILVVIFLPGIVGRTSLFAEQTMTQATLAAYNSKTGFAGIKPDKNKGNVIIMMDDGWISQYTNGFKILKRYNMRANIAVVPSLVGEAGYMDYEQLADIYLHGWDLVNHTYDHIELTGLSADGQAIEMNKGRDWLAGHLFERGKDIIVFPGGKFSDETIEVLKMEGFIAGRSLKSVWSAASNAIIEDADICNLIPDLPIENAKAAIDKAASNSSTCIFVLHKIEPVTDDSQMQFDQEKFIAIVEYIDKNKDSLNIITFSELFEG